MKYTMILATKSYVLLHYITCYLLDLHTQYCGQSPQEQFGVKCLAQGHNDMLQWDSNFLSSDSEISALTPLRHTPHVLWYLTL